MPDFGGQLREARERKGISLREIAAATKISVVALEALERNDFSRLPGGIFSRAFVRAYALEVDLDPDLTVQTFLEEFARADVKREHGPRPEVTADDRAFLAKQQRAARILRLGLVLLLLAVGAVLLWKYGPKLRSSEAGDPAPASSGGQVPPPSPGAPVTEGPVGSTAGSVPVLAPPAPANALAPTTTPASSPSPARRLVVHLNVSDDCWVAARTDGAVAFRVLLHAGDQRDLQADNEIYLEAGNSSALAWTINGQPGKALGSPGQKGSALVTPATIDRFLK